MILLLAATALAGGWTRELGSAYVKAGADVYGTVRYVGPDGEAGGAYFGQQYGAYAEVGVLPGWRGQLSASLPLVVGTHRGEVDDPFGTTLLRATTARSGDLRVAAQVALHPRLPLALSVDAKLPTYSNGRIGASEPAYQDVFPVPGDGQVDLGATLWAGATPWDGGFVDLGLGVLHRTEQVHAWDTALTWSDGVRFTAKAGHRFGHVLGLLGVDGTISPDPTPSTRSAVTASAGAMIDLTEAVALEPRLAGELWTDNAAQGLGGGLGVSWRR